jgi:hypothetical protein
VRASLLQPIDVRGKLRAAWPFSKQVPIRDRVSFVSSSGSPDWTLCARDPLAVVEMFADDLHGVPPNRKCAAPRVRWWRSQEDMKELMMTW